MKALTARITDSKIRTYALLVGDFNPIHLDEEYAKKTIFKGRIAHGMLCAGLISAAIAKEYPGSIYTNQYLMFRRPVRINDCVTVYLAEDGPRRGRKLVLHTECRNQIDEVVITGSATISLAKSKEDHK